MPHPTTRLTFSELQHAGTVGELRTADERIARAGEIWTGAEQRLWDHLASHLEMQDRIRAQGLRAPLCAATVKARAYCERRIAELLHAIDLLEVEARAEVLGAQRSLESARASVRIDQHLADMMRLSNAGLDEASLGDRLGVAS